MEQQELLAYLRQRERACGVAAALQEVYGGNVRMRLGFTRGACGESIDELQLSVRSWNALRRAGIDTIGQLIDVAAQDGLPRIRNLGRISMSEIKTSLLVRAFEELSEGEKTAFFQYVIEHNQPK